MKINKKNVWTIRPLTDGKTVAPSTQDPGLTHRHVTMKRLWFTTSYGLNLEHMSLIVLINEVIRLLRSFIKIVLNPIENPLRYYR